jgi:hypothetical protein
MTTTEHAGEARRAARRPGLRVRRAIGALTLAVAATVPIAIATAAPAAAAAMDRIGGSGCQDDFCPKNHNEHAARDRAGDNDLEAPR